MTLPGAQSAPSIVICVHDSLFATMPDLREFREEYSDYVSVYRLRAWDSEGKRRFADLTLGGQAADFSRELRARPALDELASTPYYCHLLTEEFRSGRLREQYSETELLNDAIKGIIDREYKKELLDRRIISDSAVIDFMRALAAEDMESGFQGVLVDPAKELAEVTLPEGLGTEELERFVAQMTQLPVFSSGEFGNLRFAQDALEHFLIAQWLIERLERDPTLLIPPLEVWKLPSRGLALRVVAEHLRATGRARDTLPPLITEATGRSVATKNLLHIAALAFRGTDWFRRVTLEHRDLSGLGFEELDLSGVSMKGSDLTDVEFRDCVMKEVDLEGAILRNTVFSLRSPEDLTGAKFGNLSRLYSMRVDSKTISAVTEAQQWVRDVTGQVEPSVAPCAAALQLRHLFHKFVRPNGDARRASLDKKGVLSGKRFGDPGDVLESAIRFGYFEEDFRHRIHRTQGEPYSELRAFATDLEMSPSIRELLDEVCDDSACAHVPKAAAR